MMQLTSQDIHAILAVEPPFLFIDAAAVAPRDGHIEAQVCFPAAADFFRGHFPDEPIVPGIVLMDAMAQAARLLSHSLGHNGATARVQRITAARFTEPVRPDEVVVLNAKVVDQHADHITFSCGVFKERKRCARCNLDIHFLAT